MIKIGESLFPLTYTRPIAEIRIGILTIREKWEKHLVSDLTTQTADYLQKKFPLLEKEDNVYILGGLCPNKELVEAIQSLSDGEGLYFENTLLAYRNSANQKVNFTAKFTRWKNCGISFNITKQSYNPISI